MANTTFVDKSTVIQADWLNEINSFFWDLFQGAQSVQEAKTALGLSSSSVVTENTTARTLVLSDAEAYIVTTSSDPVTITVPSGIFSAPTTIVIAQQGAGQITFTAAPGVTINSATGNYTTRAQFSVAGLMMTSANNWFLTGDVTSA
jgi:hypothetical protein